MSTVPPHTKSQQIEPPETSHRAEERAHTMARLTLRSLRKETLTMSAKNVKTLRAAHESWNKRDFAGVVSNTAKGLAYTDHGRNITLKV